MSVFGFFSYLIIVHFGYIAQLSRLNVSLQGKRIHKREISSRLCPSSKSISVFIFIQKQGGQEETQMKRKPTYTTTIPSLYPLPSPVNSISIKQQLCSNAVVSTGGMGRVRKGFKKITFHLSLSKQIEDSQILK